LYFGVTSGWSYGHDERHRFNELNAKAMNISILESRVLADPLVPSVHITLKRSIGDMVMLSKNGSMGV